MYLGRLNFNEKQDSYLKEQNNLGKKKQQIVLIDQKNQFEQELEQNYQNLKK